MGLPVLLAALPQPAGGPRQQRHYGRLRTGQEGAVAPDLHGVPAEQQPRRRLHLRARPESVVQERLAAMSKLTIWSYDWVPPGPRGFVRDLRLRWACEEAGLDYTVRTIPFEDRATNHLERQPFGQIPF